MSSTVHYHHSASAYIVNTRLRAQAFESNTVPPMGTHLRLHVVHALEMFFLRLAVSVPDVDSSGETGRFFGGISLVLHSWPAVAG